MSLKKKLEHYEEITGMSKLARRYFVTNTFDGVLTIFGVLLGSFLAGLVDARVLMTMSLGAGAAIFVSGVWGTYLAESAERTKSRKDLEKKMLRNLDETDISEAGQFATIYVSLIDGISPLIAILLVLLPFALSLFSIMDVTMAYYVSFLVCAFLFIFLGVFLGKLSKENLAISAAKSLLVGLICAVIIYGISVLTAAPMH
jgi:predicted membrane protein (TIGR00267 family)